MRLGVGLFLIGRARGAAATLANADGSALALYYLGKAQHELREFAKAMESYQAAQKAGYNGDDCALAVSEASRASGDLEGSLRILDGLSGAVEQTAEYLYQRGATISALGANHVEAIALYERAIEVGPYHCGALFALAVENDRHGNDETALDYYIRATSRFPVHTGSLLNLGVLYEDRQMYDKAQLCYERILDADPTSETFMQRIQRGFSMVVLNSGWDPSTSRDSACGDRDGETPATRSACTA